MKPSQTITNLTLSLSIFYNALISMLLAAPCLADDELFFSKKIISLDNGVEQWEITTDFNSAGDHIHYFYYKDGELQKDGHINTGFYADTAPSGILVNDTPLLVWTSSISVSSDSDVYYATWENTGWSQVAMVHADNEYADMSPQLFTDNAGNVILQWTQNTQKQIREISAIYHQGQWIIDNAAINAQLHSSLGSTSENEGYYDTLPEREKTEPFICIALGDSITAGCKRDKNKVEKNQWCSTDRTGETEGGYIDTLQPLLQEIIAESVIHNYGNPGEKSQEGAARIASVLSSQPDANCILIMYGANDRYAGTQPSATRANIEYMADYAVANNVIPIIATITPNTVLAGIRIYNEQIKALAEERGINLADQYAAVEVNWEENTSGDGLHLSETGNMLVAEEWYRTMEKNKKLFPRYVKPAIEFLFLLLKD